MSRFRLELDRLLWRIDMVLKASRGSRDRIEPFDSTNPRGPRPPVSNR